MELRLLKNTWMQFQVTLINDIENVRREIEAYIAMYEKKMIGGLTFMVDDKMCVGIIKEDLLARIHPDFFDGMNID